MIDPAWVAAASAAWLAFVGPVVGAVAGAAWHFHKTLADKFADNDTKREALSGKVEAHYTDLRQKIEDERTTIELRLADHDSRAMRYHQENIARFSSIETRLAVIEDRSRRRRRDDMEDE